MGISALLMLTVTVVSVAAALSLSQLSTAERKARLDAEAARDLADRGQHEREMLLADMATTSGFVAGDRGKTLEAILWFANAARLGQADAERTRTNLIRVQTWSHPVHLPLRALPHLDRRVTQMEFHPTGHYLLTRNKRLQDVPRTEETGRHTVWDLVREMPVHLPDGLDSGTVAVWSADGSRLEDRLRSPSPASDPRSGERVYVLVAAFARTRVARGPV